MDVKAGPSKGKMGICSESLKKDIKEDGDQGITMNFIIFIMNQIC
jgi:hypothetical protein